MKYRTYLGDVDVLVDTIVDACATKKDLTLDPVNWATARGIKAVHCSKLASYLETTYLEEMLAAYAGKDEQLREGYSYLSRPRFKKLIQLLSDTVNGWKGFAAEKGTERKPRKRKVKPPTQQVKRLKYLAESTEYGVKSIDPIKLIGSNIAVVFNQKYRTLTVYFAVDPRGFAVKGTTLINFDETKSITKTLRKPADVLPKLNGVRAVQTAINSITTKETKPTGRINEHCVLIGAY